MAYLPKADTMRITSVEKLARLSKHELMDVVLDGKNFPEIREAAMDRWRALDKSDALQAKRSGKTRYLGGLKQ